MSTTAARRAASVITNARRVVAIELLGAVRALQFRQSEAPDITLGLGTAEGLDRAGSVLACLEQDATPSAQIEALNSWISSGGHRDVRTDLERIA